jgi:hypothetical protein
MADNIWIGSVDGDPTNAANWSGAALADDDQAIFNEQSQRSMDGYDYTAAAEFQLTILVEEGFRFAIGSSGTPLEVNGFNRINFRGIGTSSSYFTTSAQSGGTNLGMDFVLVDSPSPTVNLVVLDGTIDALSNRRGKTQIKSTATVLNGGRIEVAGAGSAPSIVDIPNGVTLTGVTLDMHGGTVTDAAGFPTVNLNDGDYSLNGSAGTVALINQFGGEGKWNATNTITLLNVHGGVFRTETNNAGRTLTTGHMYGDGLIDFHLGGLNMTLTNGIRAHGNKQPIPPKGTKITWAV